MKHPKRGTTVTVILRIQLQSVLCFVTLYRLVLVVSAFVEKTPDITISCTDAGPVVVGKIFSQLYLSIPSLLAAPLYSSLHFAHCRLR